MNNQEFFINYVCFTPSQHSLQLRRKCDIRDRHILVLINQGSLIMKIEKIYFFRNKTY